MALLTVDSHPGLDIGAVDVCVFYDQVGSPIRLVQRMGRTARKRAGRVILLLGPGEEDRFEAGGRRSAHVTAALKETRGITLHPQLSKRMVPRRLVPGWPKRLDQSLAIGAWRPSQVGGPTASKERRDGDLTRAHCKLAIVNDSWRLDSTVRRVWTAPISYKPKLADAWRRGVSLGRAHRPPRPIGSDATAASIKSEMLRDVAEFVALSRYEEMYDPAVLAAHNGAHSGLVFVMNLPSSDNGSQRNARRCNGDGESLRRGQQAGAPDPWGFEVEKHVLKNDANAMSCGAPCALPRETRPSPVLATALPQLPGAGLTDEQRLRVATNKQKALALRIAKNTERALAIRSRKTPGSR